MKTLEDLEKEFQNERDKIMKQEEILRSLPAELPPPAFIHIFGNGRPRIAYKVDNLADALPILAAYGELAEVSGVSSGCFSVQPVGEHGKEYQDKDPRWEVPACIAIEQSGGKGFYSANIAAWPVSPWVQIDIEIKNFPGQWRARMSCTYTRQGDPATCTFTDSKEIQAMATARVKFAGGSRDAFHVNYYFSGLEHLKELLAVLP